MPPIAIPVHAIHRGHGGYPLHTSQPWHTSPACRTWRRYLIHGVHRGHPDTCWSYQPFLCAVAGSLVASPKVRLAARATVCSILTIHCCIASHDINRAVAILVFPLETLVRRIRVSSKSQVAIVAGSLIGSLVSGK
jgi:hypothetical protein